MGHGRPYAYGFKASRRSTKWAWSRPVQPKFPRFLPGPFWPFGLSHAVSTPPTSKHSIFQYQFFRECPCSRQISSVTLIRSNLSSSTMLFRNDEQSNPLPRRNKKNISNIPLGSVFDLPYLTLCWKNFSSAYLPRGLIQV